MGETEKFRAELKRRGWTDDDIGQWWREHCTSGRFIYFIEAVGCNRIKIGLAGNVRKRMADLQIASPFPLKLLAQIPGSRRLESLLHRQWSEYWLIGEWFGGCDALRQEIAGYREAGLVLYEVG